MTEELAPRGISLQYDGKQAIIPPAVRTLSVVQMLAHLCRRCEGPNPLSAAAVLFYLE